MLCIIHADDVIKKKINDIQFKNDFIFFYLKNVVRLDFLYCRKFFKI